MINRVLLSILATVAASSTLVAAGYDNPTLLGEFDHSGYDEPDDLSMAGRRIRTQSHPGLCVMGTSHATIDYCSSPESKDSDEYTAKERWSIPPTLPFTGAISPMSNSSECLDGNDQANGGQATMEPCEEGKTSQQWTVEYTAETEKRNMRLRVGGSNQCLDVDVSYNYERNKPFDTIYYLQIWECHPLDTPDDNQWFAFL